ncbi:unnamed protein product [Bathycoccus prasinos]
MPSFALPFGAQKKKKEEEESNERRSVGNTTSTTENHREQQQTVGTAFGKIWECYSPRFQLTRYYRYGEMDNCEQFWEDFYKSIENHTGKPLPTRTRSKSDGSSDIEDIEKKMNKKGQFLSSLKAKCEHFSTKTKEKEEENTREEEREARAFARACGKSWIRTRRKFRGGRGTGTSSPQRRKRVVVSAFFPRRTTTTRIRIRKVLGNSSSIASCGRSFRGS